MNFREYPEHELPLITIPRTWVNKPPLLLASCFVNVVMQQRSLIWGMCCLPALATVATTANA
jgi:hypothetical protein